MNVATPREANLGHALQGSSAAVEGQASAAAEGVRARERLPDTVVLGDATGERAERLELSDEHVPVLTHPLVAAADEDERLGPHRCAMAVVHLRRDDQVHLAELVLDQHEDDPLRGRRPLTGDGHSRERDATAVRLLVELRARERPRREGLAEEGEGMRPHREPRVAVVGEHPLPARQLTERRGLDRRLERERELLRLAVGSGHRRRPEREPELPQEVATRAEGVAGAALHERYEALAREPCPPREVADVAERPVRLPLGDERLRVVLSDRGDVREADAHCESRETGTFGASHPLTTSLVPGT